MEMEAETEMQRPEDTKVIQHVTKAASDKLLVKFSDVSVYDFLYNANSESPSSSSSASQTKRKRRKRVKRDKNSSGDHSSSSFSSLASWKAPLNGSNRKRGFSINFGKSLKGLNSSELRIARFKTSSVFSCAEKAWRKAVNRAYRCILEKHRRMQPMRLPKDKLH